MKKNIIYSYTSIMLSGIIFCALLYGVMMMFSGIVYILLCFAGAVIIAGSAVLVKNEGFRPVNLFGTAVVVLYLAVSFFSLSISYFLSYVCPEQVIFIKMLLVYGYSILAGSCIMGFIAAGKKAVYDKDILIILGCSISRHGGLRPLLKERTNRAIHFAWEQEINTGKSVIYVPSGGKGSDEIMSEGSAMELYLMSHGAEDYEIFPEKKSENTYENFVFSKKIIDEIRPGAKVAFVTTNYHVLRSGILAGKAGLEAEGIASRTKWYFWINGFAREFIAIQVLFFKQHMAAVIIILMLHVLRQM